MKGPEGNALDLMVEDPDTLKALKKGDQVEAVYTQYTGARDLGRARRQVEMATRISRLAASECHPHAPH